MKTSTSNNSLSPTVIDTKVDATKGKSVAKNSNSQAISGSGPSNKGDGPGGGTGNFDPNSAVFRVQNLTTFIDAEDKLADSKEVPIECSNKWLHMDDTTSSDIKTFMSRPTFMANFNWNATDAVGALVGYYDLPAEILTLSAPKVEKINRFQFFSADMVIRIVASPMQFQAGRLWIAYEPAAAFKGARRPNFLPQQTVLPGVEFDPTIPRPVELKIPHYAPMSQFDSYGQYGMGRVSIYILSPLNSAATTGSMTVSIQSWFEDVKLGVPMQANADFTPVARGGARIEQREWMREQRRAFPQAGEQEKEMAAKEHRLSDTLDQVSDIAGAISHFPLLSNIAKPVSWASSLAASAARAFGFSRPNNPSCAVRITDHSLVHVSHPDENSQAVSLGCTSGFEIDQSLSSFGTNQDEMDIHSITSRLSVVGGYYFNTEMVVGDVVAVLPVMPGVCGTTGTKGTYTHQSYVPTPMAYVASMFKYWGGSIKMRLEMVSTPFHAGRLVLAYIPDYDPFSDFSITDIGNNYSIVWDITDSSHIEFEVPWMSNSAMLHTMLDNTELTYLKNGETSGEDTRQRLRKFMNGAVLVFVLNKLVAPSSAASSINMLYWYGGGRDLTFAEPHIGNYYPSTGTGGNVPVDYSRKYYEGTELTQPDVGSGNVGRIALDTIKEESPPFNKGKKANPQSNFSPISNNGGDNLHAGTAQDKDFSSWMPIRPIPKSQRHRLVDGEIITNLRLLSRKPSPAYHLFFKNATTNLQILATEVPSSNHVLTIDPTYFGSWDGLDDNVLYKRHYSPAASGTNIITEVPSYLSYIAQMYTYYRGSRNFTIVTNPSAVVNGGSFTNFVDPTILGSRVDKGQFDCRLSVVTELDTPSRRPYFRPENGVYGYNYANTSSSTLAANNYSYGINPTLLGNNMAKKVAEKGCGLEVSVPPCTNYPVTLIDAPNLAEANFIKAKTYAIPKARRFLEVRYRPFTTATSGASALTIDATFWPLPTTIYESASDDFSFGVFAYPPLLTRVTKTVCIPKYSDGTKILF